MSIKPITTSSGFFVLFFFLVFLYGIVICFFFFFWCLFFCILDIFGCRILQIILRVPKYWHSPSLENYQCLEQYHHHRHHIYTIISVSCHNIIIVIMSCRKYGYPWLSLATFPYHSSPLAGLQGYIPYTHIAAVCRFELVFLLLLGHMWGPIGVHPLWARPCFSSSVLHV